MGTFAWLSDTKGQCFQQVAKIIILDKGVVCANIEQTTGRWHTWPWVLKVNKSVGDKVKNKATRLTVMAGISLFCLGLPVMGQQVVSVKYTGGYSTTFSNSDGTVGAGIYTGTVNGASSPGIICDDYKDEVTSGETWNATAYQASSLNSTNINDTLFGKTIGLDGYAEVATLVSMMFGNTTSYSANGYHITGITQSEIASAIWDITTPGGINGLDSNATNLVKALKSAFGSSISKAEAYLSGMTNLWILTPNPKTGVGSGEPQEMWTEGLSVPEGGAALLYLLLAGCACFGTMFYSRKRAAASIVA